MVEKNFVSNSSLEYSGPQSAKLYLQCYQFILLKQCYALIHTIGLPAELESVVKDLWALRLQLVKCKIDEESEANTAFSSQTESETKAESKDHDRYQKWMVWAKDMPILIETLGLFYLGMVLLRLPVGLGELHRYFLPAFTEVAD